MATASPRLSRQREAPADSLEILRPARRPPPSATGWPPVNIVISLAFFIFMYKYVPLLAATELKKIDPALGGRIVFNLIDGGIRLVLFLLFIWGVSLWKDIRRVYEYHGAEHKTVFAFENGDPLNTAAVQKYSTYHPRCGTSFLMTVMLISIGFYMLVPFTTFWARFASRIALLPVIAGVSYEIIRFAAKHRGSLFALMTAPGLWLQRITTKPPSDEQAQCAITALDQAMSARKRTRGRIGDCLAVPPRILSLCLLTTLQCRRDVAVTSRPLSTGLAAEPRRSKLRLYGSRLPCLNDSTKSKPATKN